MSKSRSIQEVLFVTHFAPAQPLTVLDLADLYASISNDYPVFQQQPAWDPFLWFDAEPSGLRGLAVAPFFPNPMFSPRIIGFSEDQRWSVHFQGDRVAFGWRRLEATGEPTPYPGFDAVSRRASLFQDQFRAWWLRRLSIPVVFTFCELNYFNAFPFQMGERMLKVSDIFKYVPSVPNKKIANLNFSWLSPSAIFQQAKVQSLLAIGATLDCPTAAIFNFMGSAKLHRDGSADELTAMYNGLHAEISSSYIESINIDITGNQE